MPTERGTISIFERVTYQNIDTITEEEMAEKLQQEWHALCIVNTRKRAQRLYERLQGEGVYHLSTTMYPAHRRRVLAEIRERLDDKKEKMYRHFDQSRGSRSGSGFYFGISGTSRCGFHYSGSRTL